MPPHGIARPEQLNILTKALENYCSAAHIERGTPAHTDAGRQIMSLYERGVYSGEELVKALRSNNLVGR